MKTTKIIAIAISVSSLAALPLLAGPIVTVRVPAPVVQVQVPVPVVTVPAPAITVEAVPDNYVWDGVEYVGVIGDQYYYLGPGNVWLSLDADRAVRFHAWERVHADWRDHAVRNDLYRHDAQGHDVPRHDDHGQNNSPPDQSHNNDH